MTYGCYIFGVSMRFLAACGAVIAPQTAGALELGAIYQIMQSGADAPDSGPVQAETLAKMPSIYLAEDTALNGVVAQDGNQLTLRQQPYSALQLTLSGALNHADVHVGEGAYVGLHVTGQLNHLAVEAAPNGHVWGVVLGMGNIVRISQ